MGNIQFVDGQVLFSGNQVAMDAACCCGESSPCEGCSGPQDDLIVSYTSGTCSPGDLQTCLPCTTFDGAYDYVDMAAGDGVCEWHWRRSAYFHYSESAQGYLWATLIRHADGSYTLYLWVSWDAAGEDVNFYVDQPINSISSVTCSGGKLSFTGYVQDANDVGYYTTNGCSMAVSL